MENSKNFFENLMWIFTGITFCKRRNNALSQFLQFGRDDWIIKCDAGYVFSIEECRILFSS